MDLVRIETQGRIATVSFDTGAKANALSQKLMRELTTAARLFAGDPAISAVILTGRADNFTLGASACATAPRCAKLGNKWTR
jgi:enoyl-CoA hydratase